MSRTGWLVVSQSSLRLKVFRNTQMLTFQMLSSYEQLSVFFLSQNFIKPDRSPPPIQILNSSLHFRKWLMQAVRNKSNYFYENAQHSSPVSGTSNTSLWICMCISLVCPALRQWFTWTTIQAMWKMRRELFMSVWTDKLFLLYLQLLLIIKDEE